MMDSNSTTNKTAELPDPTLDDRPVRWREPFAVLAIVVSYNARQILAGFPAPSVQITEHSISSEGVLLLAPLLECDDTIIREGVRAYLAEHLAKFAPIEQQQMTDHWTSFQGADYLLRKQLNHIGDRLAPYRDPQQRQKAYDAFREYAYQWY